MINADVHHVPFYFFHVMIKKYKVKIDSQQTFFADYIN